MICFKNVKWKNLLSTGNTFTEIDLNRAPNTLIVGANGSGKSTILDALCFGLYGKSFRKIKRDQLINSINGRDAVVEVEFESYGKQYKIIRGIKPSIFEIYVGGELLNQTAAARDYQEILEKNILRMNIKSFSQIVVLGSSSFVPFMQLSPSIRREVIEDLLDIKIFSIMASMLKDRVSATKESCIETDKDISSTKDLIKLQKDNQDRANRDNELVIEETQLAIQRATERISKVELQIISENLEIETLLKTIDDESVVVKKKNDIEKIESSLESKKKNASKSVSFYRDNDNCPTCSQELSKDLKQSKIIEKETIIKTIDDGMNTLNQQQTFLIARINEISTVQRVIKNKLANISNILNTQVTSDRREIKILNARIEEIKKRVHAEVSSIIEELELKLKAFNSKYEELLKLREVHEVAGIILRDSGIKSRIIKQYIPVINSLVNKYLASMDFFVKFELNETFEEKILSRHRDDFTYDSFSEGEKMRIDLALLFTWRSIARMKNSASTNLLILDEVFDASLDVNGCDEFLKLIHNLENANVFIISHKGDALQDKFRSSIRFEKHNNFSRIS